MKRIVKTQLLCFAIFASKLFEFFQIYQMKLLKSRVHFKVQIGARKMQFRRPKQASSPYRFYCI